MSAPAGWYPDPQPPATGAPHQQRYWDGQGWTAHVAPWAQDHAQTMVLAARTTPDGAPLAGWWQRVGAQLIDSLIVGAIGSALAFPYLRDLVAIFTEYFDAIAAAAQDGVAPPPSAALEQGILVPVLAIAGINLLVSFFYTVGFLSTRQATPGKMALGLRVRLREDPELPATAILRRWGLQFAAPGVLGLLPVVGPAGSLFGLLDVLWPLWDDKSQALHDKFARTNVVRVR